MNKSFLRNLQIALGISLILVLASSVASYLSIQDQIEDRNNVEHSRKVIAAANKVLHDLQDAETGQRGYLITGGESFLEPYQKGLNQIPISLQKTQDLVADNPEQTDNARKVTELVHTRMQMLAELLDAKRKGGEWHIEQLENGKRYMDSCRTSINHFIDIETLLLQKRSAALSRSSDNTLFFIPMAAILSLLITGICFVKIRQDYIRRTQLQTELKAKDLEMRKRLKATQRIAAQIAQGNYSVRVKDTERDDLGSLAESLNAMGHALKTSFEALYNNEWQQTGIARLNNMLVGNRMATELINDAIAHLVNYSGAINGACYLRQQEMIQLAGAYGMEVRMAERFALGEGMVGQVCIDQKIKQIDGIVPPDFVSSCASGTLQLSNIIWVPIMTGNECIGVIELGSRQFNDEHRITFFNEAARIIGIAVLAAKAREEVQTLLEETQSQTEELQAQHAELENLNTELEAQAQRLQASDEELRAQQEELMKSNADLEAHAEQLEEKNQLINQRNIEVKQKADALAKSTKYKSEFLANMSHELRTPLNSILLLSKLLADNKEKNLCAEQIQSAMVIQSAGTSLLLLIDEILDLSKIEAGKMELHIEKIKVETMLQSLKNMFEPIVAQKGLNLRLFDKINGTEIYTDTMRLEQVLRNLLSNAIKFTEKGEVVLSVAPDQADRGNLIFEVTDTGVGIADNKQAVIFEAFQQADGSTRRKYGGTGLGLSISREIVRLLGGQISVKSKLGEGSTFVLRLPIDARSKTNIETENIPEMVPPSLNLPLQEYDSQLDLPIPEDIPDDREYIVKGDSSILIIEDDTELAKILLEYTRRQGYKGVVTVRGDRAMQAAIQYRPVAILLDIRLPVMDGWAVIDQLKANPITKHIPVHVMSAVHVRKQSLSKGAIDFVNKPLSLPQIEKMFARIEAARHTKTKKVLIVEENAKHAAALAYFLKNFNIPTEIQSSVEGSIKALTDSGADCVILDMGMPFRAGYEALDAIKKIKGLEDLPIIVFTGESMSLNEHDRIQKYADSIVLKTAHSYQRVLDEVSLFLHLIEDKNVQQKVASNIIEVFHGKKILIVDDDARNIFSLSKVLEVHRMQVVTATNGKEALQQLAQHSDTDIVLMDIMMPEMDGLETIDRIRRLPEHKLLPIIAVTAKAMVGDREKCMQAGASDYISKPVDQDQLLSLLRVWLCEGTLK